MVNQEQKRNNVVNPPLIEVIKSYHKAGFVVTPLNGKIPVQKNWQKTTLELSKGQLDNGDFDTINSAGFVIPDDMIIVDVDNHDNTNGTDSLKKLSEHYKYDLTANAAVITNTASGGLHLYYKKNKEHLELPIANSLKGFAGVEFKSLKRQVVIPESKLPNGKKYKLSLLTTGFSHLKELPKDLMLDLLKRENGIKLGEQAESQNDNTPKDAPTDIKIFTDLLKIQDISLPGDRGNNLYQIACVGKDQGLSKAKVTELLATYNQTNNQPPLSQDRFLHTINSAFTYSKNKTPTRSVAIDFAEPPECQLDDSDFNKLSEDEASKQEANLIPWIDKLVRTGKDNSGNISRTNFGTQNTELFIANLPRLKGKLAVNLFSMDTVWQQPAPWHKPTILTGEIDKVLDDDDVIRIRQEINKAGFDPSGSHILEATRAVAFKNEYHPVKDYFEELPEWDGVKRLERFFPDFCETEDSKYSQELGIKLFTAIVNRIYVPGCKFDYLPIFIGEQGIGKSTLLETIAIKPQWYTDNLGDVNNKDVILRMRSKLIVENAELTMFNDADVNEVKAFLSRRTDRDRLPYDRLPRDLPRQCIIVATTNKDRFLQDETGNRRMWPIELVKIDSDGIKENLNMFYAEAIARYKAGESLYMDNLEADVIAKNKQAERFNQDDWEPEIVEWLDKENIDKTTVRHVWLNCFGRDIVSCGFREQKRIGAVLRHLGWVRSTVRIDGKTQSGFRK